ncbi:MAG: hypothetical protein GY833_10265, partial [Aestuariibacter sp.]|nr:hypothetical protein [Aestuariibacter sp.]
QSNNAVLTIQKEPSKSTFSGDINIGGNLTTENGGTNIAGNLQSACGHTTVFETHIDGDTSAIANKAIPISNLPDTEGIVMLCSGEVTGIALSCGGYGDSNFANLLIMVNGAPSVFCQASASGPVTKFCENTVPFNAGDMVIPSVSFLASGGPVTDCVASFIVRYDDTVN